MIPSQFWLIGGLQFVSSWSSCDFRGLLDPHPQDFRRQPDKDDNASRTRRRNLSWKHRLEAASSIRGHESWSCGERSSVDDCRECSVCVHCYGGTSYKWTHNSDFCGMSHDDVKSRTLTLPDFELPSLNSNKTGYLKQDDLSWISTWPDWPPPWSISEQRCPLILLILYQKLGRSFTDVSTSRASRWPLVQLAAHCNNDVSFHNRDGWDCYFVMHVG